MMRSRLLFLLVVCVTLQAFVVEALPRPDDEEEEVEVKKDVGKGKGKGKKGGDGGGGGGGGGAAEDIRADPEKPQPYISYGNSKFNSIQGKMDKHFGNKAVEGQKIEAQGEYSQIDAGVAHGKFERGHYNTMYGSFKWAEGELDKAGDSVDGDKKEEEGGDDAKKSDGDEEAKDGGDERR